MRRIFPLLGLLLTGCLVDEGPHIAFNDTPKDINDGWSIATPEEVDMNSEALTQAYKSWWNSDIFRTARSLIVIRHGKLIRESYAKNLDRRTAAFNIQSVTKSMTSLVLGIVRGQGYLQDLDQTVYEIVPEAFDGVEKEKRSITIHHLLTMSSGIESNDDDFEPEMVRNSGAAKNPMNYMLRKPMYAKPGEEYRYRSLDCHLLSGTVQKATGKSLEKWATEHLFSPLGIDDFYWEADMDGHSFGGFGLFMRPRDMAKIGQLVLQGGVWKGERIIPEEWMNQSTIPQCKVPEDSDFFKKWRHGYYWWINLELETNFAAMGRGGQYIFVFPEQDLVVVHTAMPNTEDDHEIGIDNYRFEFNKVLKAILNSIESD